MRVVAAVALTQSFGCGCFTPVLEAEVCDGRDNNGDGLVDRTADGQPLIQECALRDGVCAGHFTECVDGNFGDCDYGPNFQRVETRCDGIDNDCDGRVDKSRPKLLFSGDSPALVYGDVMGGGFFVGDDHYLLDLPESHVRLSFELEVTRRQTFHASLSNGTGCGLRDGAEFIHFGQSARPGCIDMYSVPESDDAGPDLSSIRREFCLPPNAADANEWLRAWPNACVADSNGVSVLASWGTLPNSSMLWLLHLRRDGGVENRLLDAGYAQTRVTRVGSIDGGWLVMNTNSDDPTWVERCSFELEGCQRILQLDGNLRCAFGRLEPADVLCMSAAHVGGPATVYPEGGVPFAFDGESLYRATRGPSLFGLQETQPEESVINVVTLGRQSPELVERFQEDMFAMGVSAHHISAQLYLLTWATGTQGIPLDTTAETFNAEYVCVPSP